MDDCLFCKIESKQIPAKLVYEDAELFAFEDIHPQAPTHILICPRKHLGSLTDATLEDATMLGKLQLVAAKLATDANSPKAIGPSSIMAAAQGNPCFIFICTCSAGGIFAGRRDSSGSSGKLGSKGSEGP